MTVLEALPAEKLIAALEKEHWTGRKGYSVRGMWSAFIAGVLGDCHSIAEVARLLAGNRDVRLVCGFSKDNLPGEDALARFLRKLGAHEGLLEECFSSLVEQLRQGLPGFGAKLAVDSTDIEAYANGHRKSPSDPDASWGVKGTTLQTGSKTDSEKPTSAEGKERELYRWFGYKLHLIVDASYELPIAFTVTPANESDTTQLKPLLRKAALDKPGREPQAVMADKGYDSKNNCVVIFKKCHAAPIIPLVEKPGWETPDICNAKGTPTCGCGLDMVYWGRDGRYLKNPKGRVPCAEHVGECVLAQQASSEARARKVPLALPVGIYSNGEVIAQPPGDAGGGGEYGRAPQTKGGAYACQLAAKTPRDYSPQICPESAEGVNCALSGKIAPF